MASGEGLEGKTQGCLRGLGDLRKVTVMASVQRQNHWENVRGRHEEVTSAGVVYGVIHPSGLSRKALEIQG